QVIFNKIILFSFDHSLILTSHTSSQWRGVRKKTQIMNVKILKVRLSDQYIYTDQRALDRFLQQNNVIRFESAFVKDEEAYWSVILYYEDAKMTVNESKNQKYSADTDEELNPMRS